MVQKMYRITVSEITTSSAGALALQWDSGDVASAANTEIEYGGAPLKPFTRYQWTVGWTAAGGQSSARATAVFELGPRTGHEGDWHNASWIGQAGASPSAGLYRQTFELPAAKVAWARAYVAAVGCHALELNGRPPAPDYRGICPWVVTVRAAGSRFATIGTHQNTRYMTHDLTALLTPGENVLGVLGGQVMSPDVGFIAVVMVALEGVQPPLFFTTSDTGWRATASYYTDATAWSSQVDWTRLQPGWSSPGFSPSAEWKAVVSSGTGFPTRALQMPISTVLDEVRPVAVAEVGNSTSSRTWVYTFPKNFVGTVRVKALPNAVAGSNLTIQLGEWLASKPPRPTPPPSPPPSPPPLPSPCGRAVEHSVLELGCPAGGAIASVIFASYGTPTGSCTCEPHGTCKSTYVVSPQCNAADSVAVVTSQCVGKQSCSVTTTTQTFGGRDPCRDAHKWLAAEVRCSPPAPATKAPSPMEWPTISGPQAQLENHVLRADHAADLEIQFCWHGFVYVSVTSFGDTGFAGVLDGIVGLEIRTNMTETGSITFGGDGAAGSIQTAAAAVLNGINQMTLQSQRTNVAAYMPTDCPTREKDGWMGDALDASEQAMYNFDMFAVHTAFLQLVEQSQGPRGDVPVVVPKKGQAANGSCNDIAWTAAYPQIAAMLINYRGNFRLAKRQWPSLKAYTENLIENATGQPGGVAVCDHFRDWLCPGRGPGEPRDCCSHTPAGSSCPIGAEMGGFNYVLTLRAMADIAKALGDAGSATRYSTLAESSKHGFHTVFWNEKLRQYGGDAGAVQELTTPALALGSAPVAAAGTVLATLEADLTNTTGFLPRVGAVTSKYLLNVLTDAGLHEVALKVATSTAQPSWGYWWKQGSTTCWESWTGFGTKNHIFLCGGIGHWMWKALAGITPAAPGFRNVTVAPKIHPLQGPATMCATFLSPSGSITSEWEVSRGGGAIALGIKLPVGVQRATIVVPKPFTLSPAPPTTEPQTAAHTATAVISEGGTVVWDGKVLVGSHPGILSAEDVGDGIAFATTNGDYAFSSVHMVTDTPV